MKVLRTLVAGLVLLGVVFTAQGQPYPSRPITVIVPFPPGGPTDVLARLLSEPMRRFLGQTVIVESVTGAAGTVGTGRVARSAPDGYTLSIGHWGTHVVNGAFYTNLAFDLYKDFAPVAMIATNPQLLVSKNGVPAKTAKELIAWIHANAAKVQFASGGVGGASHVSALDFLNRIKAKTEFVPYRGGAPAMQALMSGEADLYVTQIGGVIPHVRAGRLRAYLVTAKARQAAAPDIPTSDEAGVPGYYNAVWHGIWAPARVPKDVVPKLNAALVDALADAVIKARFADLGQDIPPRAEQTPQALAAFHKKEIDHWHPLIRAAGLKAE
jgi:tripartite-type tricarboxylate transporter receptor subunit TctC